jgi:hypothetical protein
MLRFVFSVLCAVFLSILCVAQVETASAIPAPRAASFCDLKRNPANYDGQWITVRGRVSMEFEDFSLYDPECNASNLPGVWLTFGGDQDEITVFCCVNRTRKKGADLEVGGHRVPLVRDEALRELQRVLQTQRLRRPDGHQCESDECYFYRPVTATITGMFLAGQAGGENSLPGYGHLGCCHLLVIKQVADVSAERTQVPAGGQFKCAREAWDINLPDATNLKNLLACATSRDEACNYDRQGAFTRIAAHWTDRIDVASGHEDRYEDANADSIGSWVSADLLTSYSVVEKEASTTAKLSITRQMCVAVSNESPNLPSDHVSCQEYAMSWRDDDASAQLVDRLMEKENFDAADARIAEASKAFLSEGDQSWRLGDAKIAAWHALQEQTQKWGVVPDEALRLDDCQDAALPDQKSRIMGCNWHSMDGMQVLGVALRKYPKSTKVDPIGSNIPWVVTDINATICQIQPRQPSVRQ